MNAKKKLYGYNRFDRMLRMIACAAAMAVIFALGGCNQTGGESSSQSSGGEEQSSESSGINIDLSSRPEEGDWARARSQIVQINGKYESEGKYIYSGGDIRIKARTTYAGTPVEPVSTKMVVLLDGFLHPFRFEDETEEKMVHTFTLEQDVETFVEATITPQFMPADYYTDITVAFFFGYDRFMDESDFRTLRPDTFATTYVEIKAENSSYARDATPEMVKITPSETIKLEGNETLKQFEFFIDGKWSEKLFTEVKPGNAQSCRMSISGSVGEQRLFLYVDGKPIQAFDDKYYATWTMVPTEDEKIGYYFNLDLNFLEGLPGGSLHNLLMVVAEREKSGNFTYRASGYVTVKIAE